ncbi:hypothetical protein B4135_2362 [Caldibacillus debilis]|uniref:Uncharacterized protein n=1 Tax=Caldibacillus debilis TaxID=301148 RepID=A0A150M0S3_9BACI|nr:hypothetical protein B4135_2362 [Caldibacillus debilis]
MNYGADHCVNSYIDIVKMLEHKAYEIMKDPFFGRLPYFRKA